MRRVLQSAASMLLGCLLAVYAVIGLAAQGGPFSAEIERFWTLISTGGRAFTNINVTGGTITGVSGTSTKLSQVTFGSTENARIQYQPGGPLPQTGTPTILNNALALRDGAVQQQLLIYGNDGNGVTNSFFLVLTPNTVDGGTAFIGVRGSSTSGSLFGNLHMQIGSFENGLVILGNEDTPAAYVDAGADTSGTGTGSRGVVVRTNGGFGFASNGGGSPAGGLVDTVLQRGSVAGTVNVESGTTVSSTPGTINGFAQTPSSLVSGLPTCNGTSQGTRAFVTDATATFTAGIGAIVAGTGANKVPVTCDGTNWRIG